jgi:hypothetical protein
VRAIGMPEECPGSGAARALARCSERARRASRRRGGTSPAASCIAGYSRGRVGQCAGAVRENQPADATGQASPPMCVSWTLVA